MIRRVALAAVLAGMVWGGLASAVPVRDILVRVQGRGLADTNSVLAYTSLKVGDEYEAEAVGRDVRSLEKTGRFSLVRVEAEQVPGGVAGTYVVEGLPRIRSMEVVGAEYLGNRKVRNLLELGAGDPVDDAVLAVRAQAVIEAYRKKYFPSAKLAWTIEPAEEAGWVSVKVVVREGKRATVKRIRFEGNRHLSARSLRKVMKQRTVNWLSFITNAGLYEPDDLEKDRESLRAAYLAKGYLDAAISEPEVEPYGRKGLRVTFAVDEGQRYTLGAITVAGVTSAPPEEIRQILRLQSGEVAAMTQIDAAAQAVRDWYGSRGRIRTQVEPELTMDPVRRVADVVFSVREGSLAYIGEILFGGNSRTKDKVVRRELAVYPGEIYNEVKVRTSERRLQNLGYFEYAQSYPTATPDPDRYDLNFELEEQRTGQLMAGAGFSSVDDVIGFVELSQGNFDLFDWPTFHGGGQKLTLRAQVGTKRNDYLMTFIEPWFLNKRLSLKLDLYQHESRYLSSDYNQANVGAAITLGHAVGAFGRVNLSYSLEQIEIFDVSTNASSRIQEEEGTYTKSALTLEYVRDTRDHPFLPTRGNRSSLSGTVAGGWLGAETDMYALEARSAQYFPLWFDHVFNLRGWASVVDRYGDSDRVHLFDRLFLGGPRTIRGFKFRDVGPRDEFGEPDGGLTAGYLTAEYTMPVAEKVRLAGFYDVGMVWEEAYEVNLHHLNSGLGFGVRFDLPGFPIQLDYTWPIDADPENDRSSGRFSFWLGYTY